MASTSTNGKNPMALDEAQVTNGAEVTIEATVPYVARVSIMGVAPLLFHAYNVQAVEEKSKAAKGSAAKKSDDIESYVYRDSEGNLGIPGTNFVAALVQAGRYMQDPRSPRKSAMDLIKAGIVPLTVVSPFTPATAKWDYEDSRRVVVQRSAVARTRPAMRDGWACTFDLLINTPEYLPPNVVAQLVNSAGRLVGLLDFRPTYGRFTTTGFVVEQG